MSNDIKNKRFYSWALIIYEDQADILDAISTNKLLISKYALSPKHDKDVFDKDTDTHKKGELKEPHFHLLITFNQNVSLNQIKNKFCFKSNIFGEKLCDRWVAFEYLSHDGFNDKELYDKTLIITNDIGYYCRSPSLDKDIEVNNKTLQLIDDMIRGTNYREMVRQYGKDYIFHYKDYLFMARCIQYQEDLNSTDLNVLVSDYDYFTKKE